MFHVCLLMEKYRNLFFFLDILLKAMESRSTLRSLLGDTQIQSEMKSFTILTRVDFLIKNDFQIANCLITKKTGFSKYNIFEDSMQKRQIRNISNKNGNCINSNFKIDFTSHLFHLSSISKH